MDQILAFLNSGLSSVLPFVVLLGILIFVHELGHFLMARWCGVRVEVFSLGFGKKIFKKQVGPTTYAISLIPLGGYVKMFGDELGKEISAQDQAESFLHKTVWQRIAIVLAGPLMNLFFAAFLFTLIAYKGETRRQSVVGDISARSAAYQRGFRSGDQILSLNGESVRSWEDVQTALNKAQGQGLTAEIKRQGAQELESIRVEVGSQENPNPLALDERMGVIEGLSPDSLAPILGVQPKSVAAKLGFQLGDQIKKINGRDISYFRDIEPQLVALQGQEVSFEIERLADDKQQKETLSINLKLPTPLPSLSSLGLESSELYLHTIVKDSPAERAGLKAGDRLLRIDDQEVLRWEQAFETIKGHNREQALRFQVLRAEGLVELAIAPQETEKLTMYGKNEKRKMVGIAPWLQMADPSMTSVQFDGVQGLVRGYQRSVDVSLMTVLSFVRLIQNKVSPKTIGGVISIGQVASQTYKMGLQHFLTMMAVISINLFILNLLPVPVLDGGHLVFYIIEAIRGAPLSMRKMEIAQQIGLALLMALMSFALFNDFSRLFG